MKKTTSVCSVDLPTKKGSKTVGRFQILYLVDLIVLQHCSAFSAYIYIYMKGPILTGVSNKLNNIDSNNGILISKNTILYIYIYDHS